MKIRIFGTVFLKNNYQKAAGNNFKNHFRLKYLLPICLRTKCLEKTKAKFLFLYPFKVEIKETSLKGPRP